jgi:hypothetical protein
MRKSCCLGDVLISVLAIRPEVCGFKPDEGNGLLRAIKICRIPYFGGEVKPEATCKILWHVKKITCKYESKIFRKPRFIIPLADSSCLLPDYCAGRIFR